MAQPLRPLIIDDHELVRRALAERLDREGTIDVVATGKDGEDAIALVKEHRPDVVMLDIDMPGLSCFDAARTIQAILPTVRLLFLSAYVTDRYIEQVLQLCAGGYLTKRESLDRVIRAIQEVAAGKNWLSTEVRDRLVVDTRGISLIKSAKTRSSVLTQRELEVLRHVASGLAQREIAGVMHISTKTVDNHCANLKKKLDLHDRVELTRFAIRDGIVLP